MTASSHVCNNFPGTWPQPWHRNTCRAAYEQETRKIILSMDKVSKVSPQGKPILNGVGLGAFTHPWMTLILQVTLPIRTWPTSAETLPDTRTQVRCSQLSWAQGPLRASQFAGMYLGAKIAILGANGAQRHA